MKITPLLFSGAMIRALLDGRETQTRRIIKDLDPGCIHPDGYRMGDTLRTRSGKTFLSKYGLQGDLIWVRETTCIAPKRFATPDKSCIPDYDGDLRYVSYRADGHPEDAMRDYKLKWTPAIHVHRWASRITLELTDVRVERLNDISEADAVAEGCISTAVVNAAGDDYTGLYASEHYMNLWDSINGTGAWDKNPWVWCLSFNVHQINIDQFLKQREAE